MLAREGAHRVAVRAPRRPGRVARTHALLPAAALVVAALAALPAARAQGSGPAVQGRVEALTAATVGWSSVAGAPQPYAVLLTGANVDLEASWRPVSLTVRAAPTMTAQGGAGVEPAFELGLEEAYALLREGPVDVSAGLQRLTLETARLTVPYQLDTLDAAGGRAGLWSARAALYAGPARLRATAFLRDGHAGGALGLRLDLTSAQVEAHALYDRSPAVGVGASGTVGDTVVYGEAWLLTGPWRGRGALGVSGYLADALWTLEAAYAPPPLSPAAEPLPQLAVQAVVPLDDGDTLEGYADVGLAASALHPGARSARATATLTWTTGDPEAQLELGPSLSVSELGTQAALTVRLSVATGF